MKKKDNCGATKQSRETEPLADLELTGEQAEQTKPEPKHEPPCKTRYSLS